MFKQIGKIVINFNFVKCIRFVEFNGEQYYTISLTNKFIEVKLPNEIEQLEKILWELHIDVEKLWK